MGQEHVLYQGNDEMAAMWEGPYPQQFQKSDIHWTFSEELKELQYLTVSDL
jgi:hypothetical protein